MHKRVNLLVLASFLGTILFSFDNHASSGVRQSIGPTTDVPNPCPIAREDALPLPSALPLDQYDEELSAFIQRRTYADLGWCVDKGVRDTGPWVDSTYYGTHPAVRIYYSPEMMYWLTGDPSYWAHAVRRRQPRTGLVPDGAMIVKEMFAPPAARYTGWSDAQLADTLLHSTALSEGWTIMVKDAAASKDGWYWSSTWVGANPQPYRYPFTYSSYGFGQDCLRCHASAEKEYTFSALRNVEGFPGSPVTFWVDDSWRDLPPAAKPAYVHEHSKQADATSTKLPLVEPDAEFLEFFASIPSVPYDDVLTFPSENYDHVVAGAGGPEEYLTSDQCMMCHSGHSSVLGPVMFLQTGPGFGNGVNVSPYGEWRWSPMGLAGRDPIFHAQLESEITLLDREFDGDPATRDAAITATVNTCLSCHGVMGKRQFDLDQGNQPVWGADFHLEWIYQTDGPYAKYGALARDGISCTTCHHIRQEEKSLEGFLMNSTTGQFKVGDPDELYGPFENVAIYPMRNTLGITPQHDPYITSSRLCGSCHTINLPIIDKPITGTPTQLDRAEKNPTFKPFLCARHRAGHLPGVAQ